jgi:hypothetical protein
MVQKSIAGVISMLFILGFLIPTFTTSESRGVHETEGERLILVDGAPRRIMEHAGLASSKERGDYLSTVMVLIRGDRVAIPVFSKDVADILAASLFRQHALPFDEQYIGGKLPTFIPPHRHAL